MESQDGISVRPMRLKVLYTFDDASKTNCLARWPNLLEIQTAHLDEKTQIGVIELKTCIQAIVSASPELVAKLGQDYTVYAYDYSEYETPLVGQGMLSWVLSSSSPSPNSPANQSKTMITGRVCKNVMGLFSKDAQETLEVKLRLVPVPTVMQSEYLDSMQRYREMSNSTPPSLDPQTWANCVRQNSDQSTVYNSQQQLDRAPASPMDQLGIERFHRILSEGSTPRDLPGMTPSDSFRPLSPAQSSTSMGGPSRYSTPGAHYSQSQSFQSQQPREESRSRDVIRPSSSASMRDSELPTQLSYLGRRESIHSGYGSGDESTDNQPRKRAKVYQTDAPGKADFNIEKQPSSLRVAASTAASVRIHRPTPMHPVHDILQNHGEEPIRPPTPISGPNNVPRKLRPSTSLLRESVQSNNNNTRYTSPYPMSDDQPSTDQIGHSPEDSRYQGIFEPSFSMPSSPPVLDGGFRMRSSPNLPPITTDTDSGFMSGGIEELFDEDLGTPLEDCTLAVTHGTGQSKQGAPSRVRASSPGNASTIQENRNDHLIVGDGMSAEQSAKEATAPPPLPRAPASMAGSRPSSRASFRQGPKPLAPAPISQSELEQLMSSTAPNSDSIIHSQGPQNPHSWAGPMSDISSVETPAPVMVAEDGKVRSGTGARRQRQINARLDKCIRSGQAPPYCENCGAIETPTWRRAWSKELDGSEQDANDCKKDTTMLFWRSLERDDDDKVSKFRIYKKTLVDNDKDFTQVLLCNPCGLWLHKFKSMRPEHKWNKANNTSSSSSKRKRPSRRTGPLSNNPAAARSRSKANSTRPPGSSPVGTDASSPAGDEGPTPHAENDKDDNDGSESPSKTRASSMEPRKTSDTSEGRWKEQDPMEALRRAIQSSPARSLEKRDAPVADENTVTPKPVRRNLFPTSHNEGPLKALGDSVMNSPRRSPRIASNSEKRPRDKENLGPSAESDLDCLFEGPGFEFDLPTSPTPKRRNTRANVMGEKRLALPYNSPTASKTRKDIDSDMSPTKFTAQKLQRIQDSPSRQNKSPKQHRSNAANLHNSEHIGSAVVDIFDDDGTAGGANADTDFLFDPARSDAWTEWMSSDYVSPMESGPNHGEGKTGHANNDDLINLILSDPEFQNENIPFGDTNMLDSALFGPEFLDLGNKDKNDSQADNNMPAE